MPEQYQYIKMPDGSYGKFRADASDDEIRGHVQKDFPDAFKAPPKPGAVSRFASSFADASGLSAVGHAIMHPGETLSNVAKTAADPYGADSLASKAVIPVVQNTVENAKKGWADYHREGLSQKTRRDFGRAVPIVGPALAAAQEQHDAGNDAGMAGTIAGTVAAAVAPEAINKYIAPIASKVPGALGEARSRFVQSAYPKNLALTPEETAAQNFVKAVKPDVAGVERVKGSASEVPGILDYAHRNNIPINGKLDFAKAAEGAAQEVQGHYDNNLLRPHSGKFQTVPPDYNGEMSGNGQNQATLGQINSRVNAINAELKSNFRKKLKSQTTEAQASDAELNAEKAKLTDLLHSKLADMNGLQPEDIAGVRQSAGKMRTLAEETKLSGNNDTLSAGKHEAGSAFSPVKNAIDAVTDTAIGGPEIVGNRVFKGALEGYEPKPTNLPQPVLPDPATTATTPAAAQQEFLRSNELEQSSQDAAAARNAEAERLRRQNVDAQRGVAQTEAARSIQGEQAAQDAASARNVEAEKLRAKNVDAQKGLAQGEVVKAVQGEQTAQDLAVARSRFANSRRQANTTDVPSVTQAAPKVPAEVTTQPSPIVDGRSEHPLEAQARASGVPLTDAQASAARDAMEASKRGDDDAWMDAQERYNQLRREDPRLAKMYAAQDSYSQTADAARKDSLNKPLGDKANQAYQQWMDESANTRPTIQDKQIVAPDPSRGIQPVTLPVEVPAPITPAETPDTHIFSKEAWTKKNPQGDAAAAAEAAKAAGYDVQD